MVFEQIEQLKDEYTDKYVVVKGERPELRRFQGLTGTVRTVNMSGRALVEFDAYENIGWYDIDVDFLTVIEEPLPKKEEKKPAPKAEKKPAPKPQKKAAPAKPAATGGAMSAADVLAAARAGGAPSAKPKEELAAAPAAQAGAVDPTKMSVAEMLAHARGEKSGGDTAPVAKTGEADDDRLKSITAQLEAARKPKTSAKAEAAPAQPPSETPAAIDPKKMSVAEMLAHARAEKSGDAAPPAVTEAAPEPQTEVEEVEEAHEEPIADEPEPAAEAADGEVVSKRDEITSIEDQIAYCRRVDGG